MTTENRLTEQELDAIEQRIAEIYSPDEQRINPAVTMLRLVLHAYRALAADYQVLSESFHSFKLISLTQANNQLKVYNTQLEAFQAKSKAAS